MHVFLVRTINLFQQQFAVQAFMAAKSKKVFCALPDFAPCSDKSLVFSKYQLCAC